MNYDSSDRRARRVFSRLLTGVGIFKKDHAGGGRAASVKMTLSGNRSSKTAARRHLRYSKADRRAVHMGDIGTARRDEEQVPPPLALMSDTTV